MGTIFPFRVTGKDNRSGYIELPYTLPQDFTLFILFREEHIDIWKKKIAWIAEKGGMALLNTHPDYMKFNGRAGYEEYPARYYEEFLQHVAERYAGKYWSPLPHQVAEFWTSGREGKKSADAGEAFDGELLTSLILPEELTNDDRDVILCDPSAQALSKGTV